MTTLIVSNIIAVKLITFTGLVLLAAVILFPVAYIIGDILTVYGFVRASHTRNLTLEKEFYIMSTSKVILTDDFTAGGVTP